MARSRSTLPLLAILALAGYISAPVFVSPARATSPVLSSVTKFDDNKNNSKRNDSSNIKNNDKDNNNNFQIASMDRCQPLLIAMCPRFGR
eukprot:3414763-Amphidinium_carterae.1